jgi:hypothetical protein
METEKKPEWITDKQWSIKPSVSWWENSRKARDYIEQSMKHPTTMEEAIAQQKRLDAQLGVKNDFLGR